MKQKIFKGLFIPLLIITLSACSSTQEEQIPDRYIEIISDYQAALKDPTSMRIYGDILVVTQHSEDISMEGTIIISVICDAKNGFGAYGGKEDVEITVFPESEAFYMTPDDEYYLNWREVYDTYEGLDPEDQDSLGSFTFEIISGEKVAETLGAEYFSA